MRLADEVVGLSVPPLRGVHPMKISATQIEKLITRWLPRLGLTQWDVLIRISDDMDNGEETMFEIQRHENAHRAVLFVPQWLLDGEVPGEFIEDITMEYIESSLVHELCHLHFRDITFVIRDDVQELLGSVVGELLVRQLSRFEEAAVDALSRALVRSWPQ